MKFLVLFVTLTFPITNGELGLTYGRNSNDDNETWPNLKPELNLRHRIKDLYPLRDISGDPDHHCRRPAKCVKLINNTCMGTRLPYDTTTLDLMPEKLSQVMIREKLHLLQSLKHIPKCWAVVQPFLCSLFMPKCVDGMVDLPSQEMCKVLMGPCRLVFNHTIWLNFIKCEDEKLFSRRCINDIREIKFNTTGRCLAPLVSTDNSHAIFEGVEGCGTPCNDPLYTVEEKQHVRSFIVWAAGICCAFNFFTIVTFVIDWRSANKYPALVIFYINCCFMVSCIGWLIQFIGNRDLIVCRKDNTLRVSEPSGEDLSCVIIFVIIYYSQIAAMVWFVILTYAWHMSFQALGKIQDRIDKKGAYFHLLAWCLPLMLTVTIMASGEIDGNHTTGICFVGYANHAFRAWFLLGPVLVVFIVGGYFLSRGLVTLIKLKISSQEIISEFASAKIRETIVRMGLFSVFIFTSVIVTLYCHIYDFQHTWEWKQSFREFMICAIFSKYSDDSDCKLKTRPSAAKLQLHLLAPFFAGILMSSWVWTSSTVDTWVRFFKRTFNKEAEEPIRLKKHKVIAQAFAKRKTFNNDGRLSISFHNTHEDPVGLNFHLNSAASQDFSSTWAAALPKLVTRRGALVGASTSVSSNRRNSTDSQYSFSVRRVSIESRRNSCDSQFAVAFNEIELKTSRVNKGKRRKKSHESRSRKRSESYKRGRQRDFEKQQKIEKLMPIIRKGSETSQESQLGLQILSTLSNISNTNNPVLHVPNMKRRTASAGLDQKTLGPIIKDFFPNYTDSDENSSSDDKKTDSKDVAIDVEGSNDKEPEKVTGSNYDESHPDETTKLLDSEDNYVEDVKDKTNNIDPLPFNEITESTMKNEKENKESAYKNLLNDVSNNETKDSINDVLKLSKLLHQQTNESNANNANKIGGQINAREIATQTSLPLEVLEIQELKQSIDEIINSRHFISKGTQISPQVYFKKSKKQPK